MATGNARAVAPVACMSSSFTKPAGASRLCCVATSRPGKRLLNAKIGRVIAAIKDPSPMNDGARRHVSNISSARAIVAPPLLEPSLHLLRLSHLCAASPNNKMAEGKPDWAIQVQERLAQLEMCHTQLEMSHRSLDSRMDKIVEVISPFLGAKICVTAGDVLKRTAGGAAQKRRGRQFYCFSLELACMAYMGQDLAPPDGMSLDVFKKDFQQIVLARNKAVRGVCAHTLEDLTEVKKLTEAVEHCLLAFEKLPKLKTQYPKQWIVVKQFETFKKLLPDEFCVRKT